MLAQTKLITTCCVLRNLSVCNAEEIALLKLKGKEHIHENSELDNSYQEGEMRREMIVDILQLMFLLPCFTNVRFFTYRFITDICVYMQYVNDLSFRLFLVLCIYCE